MASVTDHTNDGENSAQGGDAFDVAFWNLQNLFDLEGSEIASDMEFTPMHGWDRRALEFRINSHAEIISSMLLTWHNLHYYQDLMEGIRGAIAAEVFETWQAEFHSERALGDIDPI